MFAAIWSAIGVLTAGLFGTIFFLVTYMTNRMDKGFARIDARFAQMDSRFSQTDARIDALAARLDARLDAMNQRLDAHVHPQAG